MAETTIESRIKKLLSKDFRNLTTDEVVQTITGQKINIPYENPQSDEFFNKELKKSEQAVSELIKTLKPGPPPIPLPKIEALACNFTGDSLYSKIILEALKLKNRNLYNNLKNSDILDENASAAAFSGDEIEPSSPSQELNISSLNNEKSTDVILNLLSGDNLDLVQRNNKPLFDVLKNLANLSPGEFEKGLTSQEISDFLKDEDVRFTTENLDENPLSSLETGEGRLIEDVNVSSINPSLLQPNKSLSDNINPLNNLQSFKNLTNIPSKPITDFLKQNDPTFLEQTNEALFDNVDPLILSKPSNSGTRKKRELDILGFKIGLEFILSGERIVHVKLLGPTLTNDQALENINKTLESQLKNSKQCDYKDLDFTGEGGDDLEKNGTDSDANAGANDQFATGQVIGENGIDTGLPNFQANTDFPGLNTGLNGDLSILADLGIGATGNLADTGISNLSPTGTISDLGIPSFGSNEGLTKLGIPSFSPDGNFLGLGGFESVKQEAYDSIFFPEGDDPIVSNDCDPLLPEDPITGDVIATKENIEEIAREFCDPPPFDLSGANLEGAPALAPGPGPVTDPNTGLPVVDPNTGLAIDPQTGLPISNIGAIGPAPDVVPSTFTAPTGPGPNFSGNGLGQNILGIGPEEPDPEPEPVDIAAIQACLDSALEKTNKIDEKNKETARWQIVEKFLEEILYHYEIIFEYQKTLQETYQNRSPVSSGANLSDLELGSLILTLKNQEEDLQLQLNREVLNFESSKTIFLSNNSVFTSKVFDLTIADTELSQEELSVLFLNKANAGNSPVSYNSASKTWNIEEGVDSFLKNADSIASIINQRIFIESLQTQKNAITDSKNANIQTLEERKGENVNVDDLESLFIQGGSFIDIYDQGVEQIAQNGIVYASDILPFTNELKKFSVRFQDTSFNIPRAELRFKVSFMTDLGMPLPYKVVQKPSKISIDGNPGEPLKDVQEPDIDRIKLGNEYAGNGGILNGYPIDYLQSDDFVEVENRLTGFPDVAEFYDFFEDIVNSNIPKPTIINRINNDRGILYGELIEKSASNWLFFNAAERGDNDARDPSKLKPANFNEEEGNEPNQTFTDFYGNFKPKWDAKYQQNKQTFVIPKLNELKGLAQQAANALGGTLPLIDALGIRIFQNYLSMKRRMDQIEEILLIVAQKRAENEASLTPDAINNEFSDIKCSPPPTPLGSGDGAANLAANDDSLSCPPPCCGQAGSDFSTGNYLISSPPSSDCPTIFQRCWWKQFCKDATKVGLLPYPNGLPPIENPVLIAPGPPVRLGLKYWPVGYIPPAFIPIPIPNPIDGMPYIRIPLPMIWTIVPPIIIPLPLNLGIIVIFIPFIGGFMPTPLVYLKEFITGSSLFLTGIRGPRFIPRKSDPDLPDPLEKIKQALTFGIPDPLIPLPGFGQDNVDDPIRIISDLQANLTKILDNIPPPGNVNSLRDLQERELELKESILSKKKDFDRKAALLDDPQPDLTQENQQLDLIVNERKNVLKGIIKDYLQTGIPNPKSIYFPQDKDKLKIDIPGVVKSARMLKGLKSSLVPVKCEGVKINFKDEMREVLKLIKIPSPPEYLTENFNVSNPNQVFLKINKDPRTMDSEEFGDFVSNIRSSTLVVTNIILKGNKFSVVKKLRKGAFSAIDDCEKQGIFAFPPVEVTNIAPVPLKITKVPNPQLISMYQRIMDGMSTIPYTREEFAEYVRFEGETPILVIRVKDFKKIVAKKLGLSKRGANDPERPLDAEEPLVSNFPHPEGPFCCTQPISEGFGKAISLFELPTFFPPKQDQISQTPGAGGIIQATIPGTIIKNFVVETIGSALDSGMLEQMFPEINDINSPKFSNLNPQDIQKIVRNMIRETLNPESPNIPPFLDIAKIPVIPPARPTDFIEQALIGMGAPPPARIVYSLFWKYFKGITKSPLLPDIVTPVVQLSSDILTKIPWPVTVLLGRNVVNIINPIVMSDDHPSWRRMSLKNVYYVVYLDEFLRSAADVSGLFKFFLGSADPVYPIPELPSELQKAFNIKKY